MSGFYSAARQRSTATGLNYIAGDIRMLLVDTTAGTSGYTVNLGTHSTLADIPATARTKLGATGLAGKTNADGVLDATDYTLTSVTGNPSEAVVMLDYNTTTPEASLLILYVDQGPGLPVTPNGGDVTLQFDNGVNRIGKI